MFKFIFRRHQLFWIRLHYYSHPCASHPAALVPDIPHSNTFAHEGRARCVLESTRLSAETHLCCRSNEMSAAPERALWAFKTDLRPIRLALCIARPARMQQIGMCRVCTILQMSCAQDNSVNEFVIETRQGSSQCFVLIWRKFSQHLPFL